MKPFPWAEAMQFGFGVLQLSSDAFWRLTPRELAAAIVARHGGSATPLDRAAFDALLRQFPDRQEQAHD
ncbi:MAG: phage tail assembly chaperone [Rhodopseudomonas sp.]|uniref:rcc01693 family protein n=1 Tax=Rhodopseudomonas sp. TaxID=1078 RepID=UPI0017910979|nr:rcc01693 family protein [Rhodopseudomonas sp.]NVN87007.1 phage tail assembly chaperone [Rhodopseudomonas sp.]